MNGCDMSVLHTAIQSNYSSEKKDDVHGSVYSSGGRVVQHLFGKWTEGIYSGGACSARCVWRPGKNAVEYYGYDIGRRNKGRDGLPKISATESDELTHH